MRTKDFYFSFFLQTCSCSRAKCCNLVCMLVCNCPKSLVLYPKKMYFRPHDRLWDVFCDQWLFWTRAFIACSCPCVRNMLVWMCRNHRSGSRDSESLRLQNNALVSDVFKFIQLLDWKKCLLNLACLSFIELTYFILKVYRIWNLFLF